jgi:alpha-galactosidase
LVILTMPTNNTTFSAPATINCAASVLTNGFTINQVQFLNGTNIVGVSAAPPYTYAWANVTGGVYNLSAAVVYNGTNSVRSAPVKVLVVNPAPVAAMAPAVYGSRPGTQFLLYLAAAGIGGNRSWTATGLPSGLTLNPTNGIITGTTPAAGSYDISWSATGAVAGVSATLKLVSGTNLCLTPPVGWNSWNGFEGNISETIVRQIADAIVNAGLLDYGFAYVNLDDMWAQSSRLAGSNQLQANTNRFPSGLAVLGNYLHQRGLKFGIYSDAASVTCAGTQPGSYGYETLDAGTFAGWGVDYLKYDYCNAPSDQGSAISRYTAMGSALATSGRSMVFSVCEWGGRSPWIWAAQTGGQLWRTTADIRDTWSSVLGGLDYSCGLESYQRPGAWNDPDMLTAGVDLAGSSGDLGATGLNGVQERAEFSIWALLSAPMIFNADLRKLDPQSTNYDATWAANMMDILGNTEVWAVDQDPLGQQAIRVFRNGDVEVWRKGMADGTLVLGIINRSSKSQVATLSPGHVVAGGGSVTMRDLWWHVELGALTNNTPFNLAPYETRLLRLRSTTPFPNLSKQTGTIIGTQGSYNNSGETITNVFDGNLTTAFDAPSSTGGNGCWAGLDLGAGVTKVITLISYCPRVSNEWRMPGGLFQGANSADFSDAVTLFTITAQPPAGLFTSVAITNTAAFRYVRYLSPDGGWGNVAEVGFYGYTPVSTTPVQLGVSLSGNQFQIFWPSDHIGWTLQAQTNGLGTNWLPVVNSAGTNQMFIPVDAVNSAVFFRLVYP